MDMTIGTMEFEIKEMSDTGSFEGYGAVFGNVDFNGDVIEKGAFKQTLKEHKSKRKMPAMLWSHNTQLPIGEWKEMSEDDNGLLVKGQLWVDGNSSGFKSVPEAERARNMMMSNGPKGLSVGFFTTKSGFERRKFANPLDSREEIEATVRVVKGINLLEVSPTVFPANPESNVFSAKGLSLYADKRALERTLKDMGFTGREAKAIIADGWEGLMRDAADQKAKRDAELSSPPDLSDILKSINNSW